MLEGVEGLDIPRSGVLKAEALKRLGRLRAAVSELLAVAKSGDCDCAALGIEVLREILHDHIDEYKAYMADFGLHMYGCDQLAEFCLACAEPQWQAQVGLIRAEIAIFCAGESLAPGDSNERLDKAEQILIKLSNQGYDNDIEWLRCKARWLKAKGRFADAARTWARIRAARKTAGPAQTQGWQWWRAKFYEIQCWAKLPDTTKADVAHAVEVLAGSFRDIPTFWAAKLEELKARANQ